MSTQRAHPAFTLELRNAHAMERRSHELMKWQSVRLPEYPDLEARVREHLAETEEQCRRLDQCLHAIGERPSILKDMALSLLGNLTVTSNTIREDEVLRNLFTNCAFEHYEIAAYTSLLRMARALGFEAEAALLDASLREERAMADWLEQHIDRVTTAYISQVDRFNETLAAL